MSGKTNYRGIDYGLGQSNIDTETGIRYGVIPANDVPWWYEAAEANYGKPTCPNCGQELDDDCCCDSCDEQFDAENCYPEQPYSFYIDNEEITAEQSGSDSDIFIVKSKYYTRAQFCSPCAPGAGYLLNPCPTGPKTYCFGPDWFDSDNPCPYPVWEVATDKLIYEPKEQE